jgi:hypothetical protein
MTLLHRRHRAEAGCIYLQSNSLGLAEREISQFETVKAWMERVGLR